jgi:hypothetical protein
MRRFAAAALVAATAPLHAAPAGAAPTAAPDPRAVQYAGIAYDADDPSRVVYRETHFVERAGDGAGTRLVLYRCPDGRPFAVKRIRYAAQGYAPDFELVDARLGYREGVRTTPARREVFVQASARAAPAAAALPEADALVADAGFDDFVRAHWDALQADTAVRFAFLVPSDRDALGFKIRKDREQTVFGEPASVIRLTLGAWFGFILPHIDVSYSNARRELLRFEGLSNVRDPSGDNYTVRIDFDPARRQPLDPAARAAAEREPLVASCE